MIRHYAEKRQRCSAGRGKDAGVAALEFALIFGLLLSVVALIWPLGEALLQKMQLDRAMSDVIRYATAAPDSPEYDPDGTLDNPNGSRRPNCTQVQNEFYRAVGESPSSAYDITIPTCPSDADSGQTVTVTVSKTVSLGPLGDLLSIAGITHSSSVTVSAAASGREE
ncbi:MAG TPA: TadE/TadG family type IV pilus assembly protein [Mycobacteriales bacterium]|nr:TadE/TadG family type IV pilus assembly protein [Mycobacteriales bacterium]